METLFWDSKFLRFDLIGGNEIAPLFIFGVSVLLEEEPFLNSKYLNTRFLVQAAAIAAIYTVLTLVFAPVAYGESLIELRVSEMLTVLPFYTPAAIPGLFLGVILSNMFSPMGAVDVIFGSLATLLAAYLSNIAPSKWMVPIPPLSLIQLVIGGMLHYVYNFPLLISILSISIGQVFSCYVLGGILMVVLERTKQHLFPDNLIK